MYKKSNPMRIVLIVFAVLLVIAAVVLAVLLLGDQLHSGFLNENLDGSFLLGNCSGDLNNVTLSDEPVPVKSLQNYTFSASDTVSGFYLKKLREADDAAGVCLYNALLYAYENGFNYISVPAELYPQEKMERAVYYAFCDVPMIDLNTQVDSSASSVTLADGTVSQRHYIYLPTCDANHLYYKKEAIKLARAVAAEIPATWETSYEKADYLYNWLVTNVQYTADEKYVESNPHYLYDVFMGHVSDSNGFSAAYNLLMNLAGEECFSVFSSTNRGRRAWNVMKINGTYYSADAARDAEMTDLGLGNLYQRFCVSESATEHEEFQSVIRAVTPPCDDTAHDMDHVDALVKEFDVKLKDDPAIVAAREKLDAGAAYVVIRCLAFKDIVWEDNFMLVSRWFADSTVDFNTASCAYDTCVIYPKK